MATQALRFDPLQSVRDRLNRRARRLRIADIAAKAVIVALGVVSVLVWF